jgi:hypothetical protein
MKANSPRVHRKIVDYHLDEFHDWVAELECGHQQHVRHDPPWSQRDWVTTPQGRLDHIGAALELPGVFATNTVANFS